MNQIQLIRIIYYLSSIIWLLPPIRQYGGRYFYFFLFLAITDPLVLLFRTLLGQSSNNIVFPIIFVLLFLSLLNKEDFKNHKTPIIIFIIGSLFYFFITLFTFLSIHYEFLEGLTSNYLIIHSSEISSLSIIIAWVTFFFIILVRFNYDLSQNKFLNIFHIIFLFYILTNIIKMLNVLLGYTDAAALFIITTIIQIFFGLCFSIFRDDNPKFRVRI